MTLFARILSSMMILVHIWRRHVAANVAGKLAWVCFLLLALCLSCSLQHVELTAPATVTASPMAAQPVAVAAAGDPRPSPYPTRPEGLPQAKVVKVIDGDTVDVEFDGRTIRLRLIGLNTPETVDPRRPVECYGREASAKAHELLEGQTVWLEDDPSQQNRDRYDRLLRYIWLPDGRMYNLELIAQGYAYEYTYNLPYAYQAVFKQAEQAARDQNLGLWSPKTCAGQRDPVLATPTLDQPAQATALPLDSASYPCAPGQIKANRNSGIYHAPGQRNYAGTRQNVECFNTEVQAQNAGYRRARR